MRHNIEMYGDNLENGGFISATVICVILAFIGTIAGLVGIFDPAVSNINGFLLLGNLPGLIHILLYATHAFRGLPTQGHIELTKTYRRMPKKMRSQMPITRADVIGLSSSDAYDLDRKMERAMNSYNKMQNTNIINAHDWMDAVIQIQKELA